MPWNISDVSRFKKGLSDTQKRQWVRTANSVLRKCIADGGTDRTCAPSAIRQANGVVGHSAKKEDANFSIFSQKNPSYKIRTEMHQGRSHLIVPVIMMVEGVHEGNHGALLHLAEDLGRFPEAWNGIPVTAGHPEEDGHDVSANTPDLIDSQSIGRIYNTHMDNGSLKAEAWLDEEKITQISPEALAYIRQQQPLEISVGVFTEEESIPGIWNNVQYEAIARNHRPDHLALLPGGVGACSWEAGCGIRVNARFEPPESGTAPQGVKSILSRVYNDCRSRWVREHPRDKENAANKTSCSRIAWHAVEQAGWQKRGERWIKTQQKGGKNEKMNDELFLTLKDLSAQGLFTIPINGNEQGYRTLVSTIQAKLDSMDSDTRVHYLQEVFDDFFVYEVKGRGEGGSTLYKRQYQINTDESVEFTGEPIAVRRKIDYVVMEAKNGFKRTNFSNNKKKEVNTMSKEKEGVPCCEEKVDALIANKLTKFTKEDKEWLTTLAEGALDKLLPDEPKVDEKPKPPVTVEPVAQVTKEKVSDDPEVYINKMPKEIQEQMRTGLALHKEQREKMVTGILNNTEEGVWARDKLTTMDIDILKGIFTSVVKEKVDYSGFGATPVVHSEEPALYPGGVEIKKN